MAFLIAVGLSARSLADQSPARAIPAPADTSTRTHSGLELAGNAGVAPGIPAASPPKLEAMTYAVLGCDLGPQHQHLCLTGRRGDARVPIRDAGILVNGMSIRFGRDRYSGELLEPLDPGGELELRIVVPSGVITAHDVVPDSPKLLEPAAATTIASSAPLPVRWSSPTDPDRFEVSVSWTIDGKAGTGKRFEVDGAQRAFTLPPGSLPPGKTIELRVFAYNDGLETFAGPFHPDSRMAIRNRYEDRRQIVVLPATPPSRP